MKLKKRFIVMFFVVISLLAIIYFLYPKTSASHADEVNIDSGLLDDNVVLVAKGMEVPPSPVKFPQVTYKPKFIGSCEPYRPLFAQYDWNVETMLRICNAESRGNTLALNNNPSTGDYSVGLLQINLYGKLATRRPPEAELYIPENNISFAHKLFLSGGYSQWATY